MVQSLLADFADDPVQLWESNIFGKSLHELVNDGLQMCIRDRANATPATLMEKPMTKTRFSTTLMIPAAARQYSCLLYTSRCV